jgi:hypothetical protein
LFVNANSRIIIKESGNISVCRVSFPKKANSAISTSDFGKVILEHELFVNPYKFAGVVLYELIIVTG